MKEKLVNLLLASSQISYKQMVFALFICCIIAAYIFMVYRVVTKTVFYSKTFNITMAMMSVITTGIILGMQSSLVISLGMVGALSIVRFRTAIKDPMDLLFLFWSIGEGIICGAGLYGLAIILCVVVTLGILILDKFPLKRAPYLLIFNSESYDVEDDVMEIVKECTKFYRVKSKNLTKRGLDMIVEVRTDSEKELMDKLGSMDKLDSVSLLAHDGETRF